MLATVLALAACGDSDELGGGQDGAVRESSGAPPEPGLSSDGPPRAVRYPPSSDRGRASRSLAGVYDSYAALDAEAVCERMTPAARRAIARVAIGDGRSRQGRDCQQGVARVLGTIGPRERRLMRRATIGAIEVDGGRATARVSFGRQSATLRLRRVDGDWRLEGLAPRPSPKPERGDG